MPNRNSETHGTRKERGYNGQRISKLTERESRRLAGGAARATQYATSKSPVLGRQN